MLEAVYQRLRATIGDDQITYFLMTHCVPAGLFVTLAFFFLWVEHRGYLKKYRIIAKPSDPELTQTAIKETLFSNLVSGPLFVYFVMFRVDTSLNPTKMSDELPSLTTGLLQLIGAFFIEDALMYWTHRALHHPKLYKHYHKKHHTFLVSNSFASSFASPVEALFSHTLSAVGAIWAMKLHVVIHMIYSIVLVLDTINGHSGYEFPWVPFSSHLRHNFHHSHNVGTFGLKFPLWDWLMGTDKEFNRFLAKQHAKKSEASAEPTRQPVEAEKEQAQSP